MVSGSHTEFLVNFSLILGPHPLQIKKALLSTACVIILCPYLRGSAIQIEVLLSQFPRIMGIIDLTVMQRMISRS